jgi:hypothetical protein
MFILMSLIQSIVMLNYLCPNMNNNFVRFWKWVLALFLLGLFTFQIIFWKSFNVEIESFNFPPNLHVTF